jgi:hypothetical protein
MTSSSARPLPSPNFCVIPWKNFSKWHPGRSAPEKRRIRACRDLAVLDAWLDKSSKVTSVSELLE